jgi:16S rRNA (guanine527-N7)-methyltransferase
MVESLFSQYLELWQKTLQWSPNELQQQQFEQLYTAIVETNQQFNLTRITDPESFWEKHLWDSIAGVQGLGLDGTKPLKAIDIGTGAGFPGLPLAIMYPHWVWHLNDSTGKKVRFINTAIEQLGLTHAKTLQGRIEEIGQEQDHRHQYQLVTSRAVSKPTVCAEYSLPLLKVGGVAILYRGTWDTSEEKALERSLAMLGGELANVVNFTLPITGGIRNCIHLKKIKNTDKSYPRPVGIPTQKPL